REPGMCGVGSHQLGCARRWVRPQVAAYIARGQAERPQRRNGEMRKILANTAPLFEHLRERRGDGGRSRIVFEIGKDSSSQVERPNEQRHTCTETFTRIISQ